MTRQWHVAAERVQVVERQLDADPAGDGEQMDHRVGRAADRRQCAGSRSRTPARVRIFDSTRSSRTISTMRRPAMRASTLRRASTAGMAALPGRPTPSASTMQAMVEAVPMVMQWPWLAVHAALGLVELLAA